MKGRRRPGHVVLGRREIVLACALVIGIAVVALVLAYLTPAAGQVAPLESDVVR